MRYYLFIVAILLLLCGCQVYKFAGQREKVHCAPEVCPGNECLCILGPEGVWYFNPTIGDIEEDG